MKRHLHLQLPSGISGDMWLGMLVDLGADRKALEALPTALGLDDVRLEIARVTRGAFAATRVGVIVRGNEDRPGQEHGTHGPAAHLSDALAIIDRAPLSRGVKEKSSQAMRLLFEAEAKVHGIALEKTHLHEASAEDTLIDIVGAYLALETLEIASVSCATPLPVGSGTIEVAHGIVPVPAPAVVELLQGIAIESGPLAAEMITPTGAALLRSIVDEFSDMPAMTLSKTGIGAGYRDDSRLPNVARGMLGVLTEAADLPSRRIAVIETCVDDMNPQDIPVVIERLLDASARDAFVTHVLMKKGRPGYLFTAISDLDDAEALAQILLEHTSTLGVRVREESRREWRRDSIDVETPWGPVRIKRALSRDGRVVRAQPEFEDCRTIAEREDLSVDEVRRRALRGDS